MNPVLLAARDELVTRFGAVLVVAYGSFASGTATEFSDIDVVAWAPVEAACQQGGSVAGFELDAWVYPLDHPFSDPALARVHPAVCLLDTEGRFADLGKTVAEQRRQNAQPLTAVAKADAARWVAKMLTRAEAGTAEGWQRYHWLLSDAPELWCQFRDLPWEGPKKALGLMKTQEPELYAQYARVASDPPSVSSLASWFGAVIR